MRICPFCGNKMTDESDGRSEEVWTNWYTPSEEPISAQAWRYKCRGVDGCKREVMFLEDGRKWEVGVGEIR